VLQTRAGARVHLARWLPRVPSSSPQRARTEEKRRSALLTRAWNFELFHTARILLQQAQEIAHRRADHDLARFVLLKRPRTSPEELASFALREPQTFADRGHALGGEEPVDVGLQGHESAFAGLERFGIEDALTTGATPPALRAEGDFMPLVLELLGLGLESHLAAAFGTWLRCFLHRFNGAASFCSRSGGHRLFLLERKHEVSFEVDRELHVERVSFVRYPVDVLPDRVIGEARHRLVEVLTRDCLNDADDANQRDAERKCAA